VSCAATRPELRFRLREGVVSFHTRVSPITGNVRCTSTNRTVRTLNTRSNRDRPIQTVQISSTNKRAYWAVNSRFQWRRQGVRIKCVGRVEECKNNDNTNTDEGFDPLPCTFLVERGDPNSYCNVHLMPIFAPHPHSSTWKTVPAPLRDFSLFVR